MNHNDIEKIKNHWVETTNDDFETMNQLFKSKSYNWALFVGHISVEKLLKALYVKLHGKHAPTIHNLYRLAELFKINLTDEFSDSLDTITSFNINARYDDYKKEFFDLCTREYTESWIDRIKGLRGVNHDCWRVSSFLRTTTLLFPRSAWELCERTLSVHSAFPRGAWERGKGDYSRDVPMARAKRHLIC